MTVPQTATDRKPPKAFYALLHDVEGTLSKLDDTVYFLASARGTLTPVTSYDGLTVLGEIGLADTQRLMDTLHGNLARIATRRQQEVA
jgi:hypothetical protein